ncbi:MAG: hypothetical protein E7035_05780 [Verrucomicrobiaceae bacterium]|nr:hypothetical protein [Verrucomicrobiaceae bacterium]
MAESTHFLLQDLAIIVVASTVAIRIFSFLKLPQLLGFIVTGILLSPVFNVINDKHAITQLGELGVMFMMFFVGMEFDLNRLKKVFAPSFFGILFQIIVMGLLGMASASMMNMTNIDGIFLGGVLAMSSTIVIVEVFTQRRDLGKPYAQIATGILILEDLFAVFLLVILSGIADGAPDIYKLGQSTITMLAFVITIFVLGKLIVPAMLKKLVLSKNTQELIMFTLCLMMGIGFLALSSGMSLALGAFLAGSIISGTFVSQKIEHLSTPFRNLFVALFFVSVGTMIEPGQIIKLWLPIVLISVAVIVLQTFACFLGIVLGGARCKDGYLAAINKAQIGEFSFVIAGLGITLGVMDASIMAIAMGVSFLTVFVNPFLANRSDVVMDFFKRFTPSRIKTAFDIYHDSIVALSHSTGKSQTLKTAKVAFIKITVYSMLFCALMLIAPYLNGVIEKSEFCKDYAMIAITVLWIIVAVISMPIAIGIAINLEDILKLWLEQSALKSMNSKYRDRLARYLNGVFAFVIGTIFTITYLAVLAHYLPLGELSVFGAIIIVVLGFIFRKVFRNIKQSLEGRFSGIVKRDLENAMHHRHDMMLARIKKSYKWSIEIIEVEITEMSVCAGKQIGELQLRAKTGSEVVAIRRGMFVIYNLNAQTRIFPNDVVVLSGTSEDNKKADEFLSAHDKDFDKNFPSLVADYQLRTFIIPTLSSLVKQTLAGANLNKVYSVKILAISRNEENLRPLPNLEFCAEDKILAMGSLANLEKLRDEFFLIETDAEMA